METELKTLELTKYAPIRAEIEKLRAINQSLVFDYEDPAGNKNARSHIYKMRQTKGEVERTRKELKADALEFGRKVDAAAKELTADLESMIDVHQKPLDTIEERKQAKIRAEKEAADKARLEAERIEREKQDALLAAERARAEKLEAELAAQRQKEREEQIAREAAEKARQEAEAKAKSEQEAARRREQEAVEAERRALQAAQEAEARAKKEREDAERQRVEAEQQAIRDRQEAERKAEEAAELAKAEQAAAVERARQEEITRQQEAREQAEREAAERASNAKIRNAITNEISHSLRQIITDLTAPSAKALAAAMFDGKIPHVTVDTRIQQ